MRCPSPLFPLRSLATLLSKGFVLILLLLLLLPAKAFPLFVKDTWVPDGPVWAMTQLGNTIYLGGAFTSVGQLSGPAAAFEYGTGVAQQPFSKVVGQVLAVEPDGNGGWYLGGNITSVQGKSRNNLAHIDASGAVTSWNPGADGTVQDIALGNGIVYIVGGFANVGGAVRSKVAGIDAGTGLVTSFQVTADAAGAVNEVEFGAAVVYLGGSFLTINGLSRTGIAAVDPVSGALLTVFGAGPNVVHGLEYSDGRLYVGALAGTQHSCRVFDTSFNGYLPYFVNTSGPVNDLLYDPFTNYVWIGGSFSTVGGQPRQNLAMFDRTTGGVIGFALNADGEVHSLCKVHIESPEGTTEVVLVGGGFNQINTAAPRRGFAGILSTFPFPSFEWGGYGGGTVRSIEIAGTTVYAGGEFQVVNAVPRASLAAIDATSGSPLSWNPSTDGTVNGLYVSGSTVYIGGQFTQVNGNVRNRVASVDAISGALTAFNPNVQVSGSTTVRSFARNGSTLFIGGTFGTVGGVARTGVAAVDATTGALQPWNGNVNGTVNTLTFVPGSAFLVPTVYIGGLFTQAGGQARNNLAGLDATTAELGPFNPNVSGEVHALVIIPTPIGGIETAYVGGTFSTIQGQARNSIAAVSGFGVLPWSPNANGGVYSILLQGSSVYAAGNFTSIGGQFRSRVAELDIGTGAATAWSPNVTGFISGVVTAMQKNAGTVYAGGVFANIAGVVRPWFAGVNDGTVTGIESEPTPDAAPVALRATPNPFRFETAIQFSLASGGGARVTVYDVAGRRVREIHRGWLSSGRHTMGWDGRDDAGAAVASGIYFVGVRTDTERMTSKVYRQ